MKSGGGARIYFVIFVFVLGALFTDRADAGVRSLCSDIVTRLRIGHARLLHKVDVHEPLVPIRGVVDAVAVSIEKDGRFLLGHRLSEPMKNMWGQFGGKIDAGESVVQAAKRELFEELGIDATEFKYEFVTYTHLKENGKFYRVFVLSLKTHSGDFHIKEPHKTSEMRWFARSQIPFFLTSATAEYFLRSGLHSSGIFARQ